MHQQWGQDAESTGRARRQNRNQTLPGNSNIVTSIRQSAAAPARSSTKRAPGRWMTSLISFNIFSACVLLFFCCYFVLISLTRCKELFANKSEHLRITPPNPLITKKVLCPVPTTRAGRVRPDHGGCLAWHHPTAISGHHSRQDASARPALPCHRS